MTDEPQSWRAWPVIKMIPADQVRPPDPAGLAELRDRMDRQTAENAYEQHYPGGVAT